MIAGSIFLVGIGIVREVVFGESQPLEALPLVTVLALASAGVSYVLARLQTVVGEAEGSPGLVASGAHARVQVNFESAGTKWLVMAYANLELM